MKELPKIPELPPKKKSSIIVRILNRENFVDRGEFDKRLSKLKEELKKDISNKLGELNKKQDAINRKLKELAKTEQPNPQDKDVGKLKEFNELKTIVAELSERMLKQKDSVEPSSITELKSRIDALEISLEELQARVSEELNKIIAWINYFNEKTGV